VLVLKKDSFIGIDIGGIKTAVSLWSGSGTIIKKEIFPTTDDPLKVISRITHIIQGLKTESAQYQLSIAAIGISCSGPLDHINGYILSPPHMPGWNTVPIVSMLHQETGLPCFLENDANAGALAEWRWGAGRGFRNIIFIVFGVGIGAGLILDGHLYRGVSNLAGEVGHLRVAESGPIGYDKAGSIEGLCSGGGISRMYAELTGREESGKYICEAAEAGDREALKVIETCSLYLGRCIALLIDILNPQRIVIGNIFVRSEQLFRTTMEAVIKQEALPKSQTDCQIVPAQLGELLGDKAAFGVAVTRYRNKN
jgi:glucokinase